MTPDLTQPLNRHLRIREDLPPAPLRAFLDEMALGREQITSALIFADWLDEQEDARGQAVRWSAWKAQHDSGTSVYKQTTTRLREWVVRHGERLLGDFPRGVSLDWKRGLLRISLNAEEIDLEQPFPWHQIQELIDAGWLGEAVFRGNGLTQLLRSTIQRWTGIPRVELIDPADVTLERLEDLPSLRELILTQGNRLTPFVFNSLRAHPHLEALEIEAPNIERLSLYDLPTLRELRLHGCEQLAHLFLHNLPAMESFDLEGPSRLSEFAPGNFPSLRTITLNETEETLIKRVVLQGFPALEEVLLLNVRGLGILSLTHLPALRRLETSGSGMHRLILESLPRIERLRFLDCRDLREATLRGLDQLAQLHVEQATNLEMFILEEVPALKEIALPGCDRLRAEVRLTLAQRYPGARIGG